MKKQSVILNFVLAIVVVVLAVRVVSLSSGKTNGADKDAAASIAEGKDLGNGFRAVDIEKTMKVNPFDFFTGHGLLLCAGDKQGANAMTIGWGALGTLWGKSAVTVYVREERYTHEFLERCKYFTVMKFADNKVVDYMGSHSGRDGDKAKALGLTLAYTPNGAPYYLEASMVIECRLIDGVNLAPDTFRDNLPHDFYMEHPDGGIHTQYIGEVVSAAKKVE